MAALLVAVVFLVLAFLVVIERNPFAHGAQAMEFYESSTTGLPKGVHIYCPTHGTGTMRAIVTYEYSGFGVGMAVGNLCP